MKKIIAYKGFKKDLTCRGFQYEVGKTYKHEGKPVRCANSGFHSCENPLDIFSYYDPSQSVFHIVEASGDIVKDSGDTKIASAEIKIKAELKIPDLIKRSVDWVLSKVDDSKCNICSEHNSHASNTGNYSAASNTGNCSAASNTGDRSAASNTGNYSAASNTGDRSAASNTGNYSAASNTGNYSAASVEGSSSVAIATGIGSKARASKGSAITLVYRNADYEIIHIRSGIAGKDIQSDTWYSLSENGEFIEVLA